VKYKIAVIWSMSGTYEVEADSLTHAKEKIENAEPPYEALPKGQYIDDSLVIDNDTTDELNEGDNDDI